MVATLSAARKVIAETEQHGGGTFWLWGETVTHIGAGYLVGGVVPGLRLAWHTANAAKLERNVRDFMTVAARTIERVPCTYLGTWVSDDGWLYLDVVEWQPNIVKAVALGIARGELAIYDCRAKNAFDCQVKTARGRCALEKLYE